MVVGDGSARSYLESLSAQGRFSGCALVTLRGRPLVDAGFGFANKEENRANRPDIMFQIASVSKQFAAGAILLLQEQGRLSVQDRIATWIPTCPEEWGTITIHHLLTHTSGIVHWRDLPELDVTKPMDREGLIRLFQSKSLKFSPGKGWAYSSPAYVLIASIVEAITGDSYGRFLQRSIFRPLDLRGTVSGWDSRYEGRLAHGYGNGTRVPSMELDSLMIGAGDICSTTHDLRSWDDALASPGRLFSMESLNAMFAPHAAIPKSTPGSLSSRASYGYGWFMENAHGVRTRYHTGDNPGFRSINAQLPELDAAVILLANDEGTDAAAVGEQMLGMLADERGNEGHRHRPV